MRDAVSLMLVDVSVLLGVGLLCLTLGFIFGARWAWKMFLSTLNEALALSGKVKKAAASVGKTTLKGMLLDVVGSYAKEGIKKTLEGGGGKGK